MSNEPKIVLWDLETLHDPKQIMRSSTLFSIGNWPGRTLSPDLGSIISFGYKILGQDKAECINVWDFDGFEKDINDDSAVVAMAYEVLRDADLIVTHNGRKYDIPYLNNRLMKNGFPSLHKIPDVDTKVVAKRIKPFSAKLDELAFQFNLSRKMSHTGAKLWDDVRDLKPSAMKMMSDYCKQDVEVLEELYLMFRPLMKNSETANHAVRAEGLVCDNCGSHNLSKNGTRLLKSGRQQRYICGDCGSNLYVKKNNKIITAGV